MYMYMNIVWYIYMCIVYCIVICFKYFDKLNATYIGLLLLFGVLTFVLLLTSIAYLYIHRHKSICRS